ncbi:membrane-associated, eicosanoid/glutathione metabolism protein [Annulohypoxylon truncatum]|uniref:membrane-associated, eicosanoid/glutathione metabolism protein n=1 Tax=Annulohypoxylon truncatum TaxID=327061 RepID=UPI0020086B00|nr:membrane-associated, eicosanoid/glutathione metabolism protein [Annulohypoxylon truncatum]KAI1214142.1 membrane-associated, eicosanoid/glutathione metabolism protein [Annulohypoxylon truncatum]
MTSQPGLHLPVTGAFALPFAAYYIFLSGRVVRQRLKYGVAIGDRVPPPPPTPNSPSPTSPQPQYSNKTTPSGIHTTNDPLHLLTRAQQNFAEFVPLALLLAVVAELNGAGPAEVRAALGTLLAARVLHAEAGILGPDAMGLGRPVGFYSTLGVLGYLGWLGSGFGFGGWL